MRWLVLLAASLACSDGAPEPTPEEQSARALGAACTPDATKQGDCAALLECDTLAEGLSACSRPCLADGDCGSIGAVPNLCVSGRCRRGCETSCPTAGLSCWPRAAGRACLVDCRLRPASCTAAGTSCDSGSGGCFTVGTARHYEKCGPGSPSCVANHTCTRFNGSQGRICLMRCDAAGVDCPGTDTCSGALDSGGRICVRPCTPALPSCPPGTACETLAGGVNACMP